MNAAQKGGRKRGKIVAAALGSLVLVLIAVLGAREAEPKYRDRTLTSWLQQCWQAPLENTQRLAEAQEAVRAIGAQRALPVLLKLVKSKDNPVSTWIRERAKEYRVRSLRWRSAERQYEGLAGFKVLGTNCAPAVGELTKLLDDKELAFVATQCLANVGKAAEGALCQCLTNENLQARHLSVSALATVTDDVGVYISRITPRLNDVEPAVRFAAVQAIAAQNEAPELAVPLLISALSDGEDSVCSQAMQGLAGFGTNALSAVSALTNLATTGRLVQMREALKALTSLAPGEALPLLSNAVVNANPQLIGPALRDMKSIAPELALEMTLAKFHSTDAQRRLDALNLAWIFDVRTPGIVEALKSAAASDDAKVARHATMIMRYMLNEEKAKRGAKVDMPNEPSYQGKPLAEWLSMRRQGWELDTNAVLALQAMGTNTIPALLARVAYREPVFNLDDPEVNISGVAGLIALREQAKPALPILAGLMESDNGEIALRAMMATLGTGVDAMPCLIQGLTNRYPDVRSEGAYLLTDWGKQFPEQRKQAIPYMMKLLDDPDQHVRMSVQGDLKELDAQAAAGVGSK